MKNQIDRKKYRLHSMHLEWIKYRNKNQSMALEIWLYCYENGLSVPNDVLEKVSERIRTILRNEKKRLERKYKGKTYFEREIAHNYGIYRYVNYVVSRRKITPYEACKMYKELLEKRNVKKYERYEKKYQPNEIPQKIQNDLQKEADNLISIDGILKAYNRISEHISTHDKWWRWRWDKEQRKSYFK